MDYISKNNTKEMIKIMQAYVDGHTIKFTVKGGDSYGVVTKIGDGLHEWNFKEWNYAVGD
jgi:hypothetical protein